MGGRFANRATKQQKLMARANLRIGIIGFPHNSGLGTMTMEFCRYFPGTKALLIDNGRYKSFPDRFPGARLSQRFTKDDLDWLLCDIDLLVTFETPIEWRAFAMAAARGIKTVLIPMYECMPQRWPALPDLILCPSRLDYTIFHAEFNKLCKVEYLQWPVNREKVPFNPRKTAKVFEHHAGHGGLVGRNGTAELLAAIPMLKSDAQIVIYSQREMHYTHPKLTLRVGNYANYWDIWGSGDVFVFPHKFDGLSLPVQEALSNGMPVLSTEIPPFIGWLPQDWFFGAAELLQAKVFDRMVDIALPDPAVIAAKIDAWYGTDISEASRVANKLAAAIDWEVQGEKLNACFKRLCVTS